MADPAADAKAPPTPIDPQDFDNFVRELQEEGQHHLTAEKRKARSDEFDDQVKKFDTLVKSLWTLLQALYDPHHKKTATERERAMRDALVALFGVMIPEKHGGKDIPEAVDNMITIWQGTADAKTKQQLLESNIKKLLTKAGNKGVELLVGKKDAKEWGKGVDTLVEQIIILVKLGAGTLTDKEREDLLTDEVLKLLTSDLIVRQIEWFVSENFLTYLGAVKLGYQLGKPFGDRIAADLATVFKARYGTDVLIALEHKNSSWTSDAASGTSTQATIESGSFTGWQATAFWDHSAGAVRIQVITPQGGAKLLDEHGVDVTGELPVTLPPDPAPTSTATSPGVPLEVQRRVDTALEIAKRDAASQQAALDQALAARDAAGAAWAKLANQLMAVTDPELSGLSGLRVELQKYAAGTPGRAKIERQIQDILDKRAALESQAVKAWVKYQLAYDAWHKAVVALRTAIVHGRRGLRTAAKFEHWGAPEINYLQWLVPQWAFTLADIPGDVPPKLNTTSSRILGPGALMGAGAACLAGGLAIGFAAGHTHVKAATLATPTVAVATTEPAHGGGGPAPTAASTTAPPSAASNRPPVVGPISATFVRPVTTYRVTASDPDGDPLTFTWSKTPERPCGAFGGTTAMATWTHPDASLGGNCPDEDVHPGTITVTVSDGHTSVTATYPFGSGAGVGPAPAQPATPPPTSAAATPTAAAPAEVAVPEVSTGQAIDASAPSTSSSSDVPLTAGGAALALVGVAAIAVGGDLLVRKPCDCTPQDNALSAAKAELTKAEAAVAAANAALTALQQQIADVDASILQTQATLNQATQDLAAAQQQLATLTQFVNGLGPVVAAGSLSNHAHPGWQQVGSLWAADAHAADMARAAVAISTTIGASFDPSTWQAWGQGELAAAQATVAQLTAQVAASTAYLGELNATRNTLVAKSADAISATAKAAAAAEAAQRAVAAAQAAFDACVQACPSYLHG